MSRPRLTKRLRAAIRAYYDGWRGKADGKWDKQACLNTIRDTAFSQRPKIVGITACAGTFWFRWASGLLTEHNHRNWWTYKRCTRFGDTP